MAPLGPIVATPVGLGGGLFLKMFNLLDLQILVAPEKASLFGQT